MAQIQRLKSRAQWKEEQESVVSAYGYAAKTFRATRDARLTQAKAFQRGAKLWARRRRGPRWPGGRLHAAAWPERWWKMAESDPDAVVLLPRLLLVAAITGATVVI